VPVAIRLSSLAAWIRLDPDVVRAAAQDMAQAGWIQLAGDEIRSLQDPAASGGQAGLAPAEAVHFVTSTADPCSRPLLSCA
jgi:hypothetical protein